MLKKISLRLMVRVYCLCFLLGLLWFQVLYVFIHVEFIFLYTIFLYKKVVQFHFLAYVYPVFSGHFDDINSFNHENSISFNLFLIAKRQVGEDIANDVSDRGKYINIYMKNSYNSM